MICKRAAPAVAFDLLSGDPTDVELVAVRGDQATELDPRWLELWLGAGMRTRLYERFGAEALDPYAQALLDLRYLHLVDDGHPGKRAILERDLATHFEPDAVTRAAQFFIGDPERRDEVLDHVVEALYEADDLEQAQPLLDILSEHSDALGDHRRERLAEIAAAWKARTTGHVGWRHFKKIAKAIEKLTKR